MITKADAAAAERVLKRAVAKAVARLKVESYGDSFEANVRTFMVAIDAAVLLTEERVA